MWNCNALSSRLPPDVLYHGQGWRDPFGGGDRSQAQNAPRSTEATTAWPAVESAYGRRKSAEFNTLRVSLRFALYITPRALIKSRAFVLSTTGHSVVAVSIFVRFCSRPVFTAAGADRTLTSTTKRKRARRPLQLGNIPCCIEQCTFAVMPCWGTSKHTTRST